MLEEEINWEIGQDVVCACYGYGKIVDYDKSNPAPVVVRFNNVDEAIEYDEEGRLLLFIDDSHRPSRKRMLWFSEPKITALSTPKAKKRFAINDLVLHIDKNGLMKSVPKIFVVKNSSYSEEFNRWDYIVENPLGAGTFTVKDDSSSYLENVRNIIPEDTVKFLD